MIGYCAEHKDQRKAAFLAAITTDCPYCRIAELEQQLAERDGEIALLRKQSVGWVQVFDENATLRAEVDRLREQAAFAQKELTDVIHTRNDSHECIRKQAAQEILEWLLNHRPLSYAARPHFDRMVSKFKTEFGLEG